MPGQARKYSQEQREACGRARVVGGLQLKAIRAKAKAGELHNGERPIEQFDIPETVISECAAEWVREHGAPDLDYDAEIRTSLNRIKVWMWLEVKDAEDAIERHPKGYTAAMLREVRKKAEELRLLEKTVTRTPRAEDRDTAQARQALSPLAEELIEKAGQDEPGGHKTQQPSDSDEPEGGGTFSRTPTS